MVVSSVTPCSPRPARPALPVRGQRALQAGEEDPELLGVGGLGVGDRARRLALRPPDAPASWRRPRRPGACWGRRVRPGEGLLGAPPVLLQRLALPGEHRNPGLGDRRRGVVLGGEDVAGGPAHLRPQGHQGLDQDGRLHGHVQGAGDARPLERLGRRRAPRGVAISPGISCSARAISLRPKAAREMSATLKSAGAVVAAPSVAVAVVVAISGSLARGRSLARATDPADA